MITTSLVDLLGPTRAQLVDLLRAAPASVAMLAGELGLSEPGVRKHLVVLEREGLVAAQVARRAGPGRPGSRYALTDKGRQLYPDRSSTVANEALEYLEDRHGRPALLEFLRWRQAKQADRYEAELAGIVGARDRTERLTQLLSDDGFLAKTVVPQGAEVLELHQQHCAIADVAAAHPELCAYEAALFQRLLGTKLSRRRTIAGGAPSCVCTITPTTGFQEQ